jgi:drug/metabolite transporter (DMT)-like permease
MNQSAHTAATPASAAVSVFHSRRLTGIFMATVGAILFAGKAVVVKLTYRYGIDSVTLIALRMLFAAPFFVVVAWWQSRRAARGEIPVLTRNECLQIWVLGLLGYYLSSFLDFLGLKYVSAGLERLILYLSPSMVVLIAAWWLKRRVTKRQWTSMFVCYLGVVLVFAHDLAGNVKVEGNVPLGAFYVFLGALTYAIYLTGSGELVKRVGATRLVAYAMLVSCLASVIQYLCINPVDMLFQQPVGVYGYSVIHATLNTVLPVFMLMWAVALVGAPTASLLSMVGPVSVLFMAAWLLDEPITPWQLMGTVLVLSGVFVLSGGARHAKAAKAE